MKVIKGTTKTIFIALVLSLFLTPGQASAQSVSGRDFNIFVYSDTGLIDDASTKIRFETNGTLLIDAFDGFGAYLSAGPLFAGFFYGPGLLMRMIWTPILLKTQVTFFCSVRSGDR